MVCSFMRSALILSVVMVLFGTSSSLLVTIGKRSKPASKVQLQQNSAGKQCATDADCSTLLDTSCIQTGLGHSECLCQDMEPPRFGHCMLMQKDLHIACTDGQDCVNHGIVDKSIECRNSTCYCKVGYFAVEKDLGSCEQVTFIDETAKGSSTTFSRFVLLVMSIAVLFAGSGD